jgi:hypothetical protein
MKISISVTEKGIDQNEAKSKNPQHPEKNFILEISFSVITFRQPVVFKCLEKEKATNYRDKALYECTACFRQFTFQAC